MDGTTDTTIDPRTGRTNLLGVVAHKAFAKDAFVRFNAKRPIDQRQRDQRKEDYR